PGTVAFMTQAALLSIVNANSLQQADPLTNSPLPLVERAVTLTASQLCGQGIGGKITIAQMPLSRRPVRQRSRSGSRRDRGEAPYPFSGSAAWLRRSSANANVGRLAVKLIDKELVEREDQLVALAGLFADCRSGRGRVAKISGAVTSGKTLLLQTFEEETIK